MKKKNFSKKKNKPGIPSQIDRVDKELLQEVSVLLDVKPDIDNKTLRKLYHITDIQADFIRKHREKWEILDKITKNGRE